MADLNSIALRAHALRDQLNVAKARLAAEKDAHLIAQERVSVLEDAQAIGQQVAQMVQQEAHNEIADVVTQCLQAVFDEPYRFIIHFEKKRGRTEARLVFERDGLEVDPMTASGGGVVDVAAFALRLSCLMLSKPPLRRMLILDEPFKFVSPDLRPRVRKLMETLAEEKGIQILMVTHIEGLKTGGVIQL
jgi:DNA repair exonuclease SbcCD ATPase subunit